MASRTPKRNASGRFQRCVAKVSARPGVASPRGVCAAAGRKKYGAKKFAAMAAAGKRKARGNAGKKRKTKRAGVNYIINPLPRGEGYELRFKDGPGSTVLGTFDTYAEANAARAADWARRENRGRRLPAPKSKNNAGREKKSIDPAKAAHKARERERRTKDKAQNARAWDRFGKRLFPKKSNGSKRPAKRKNPLDAAQNVYRKFHGRDADKVLTVTEPMHVHKYLSGIGDLVGLQILTHDGRAKVTLKFEAGAVLAQNEKRNQLFIRGGDQSVNLKDFGITGPHHELENLGEVIWISYYTRKDHLAPEDGGEAIYRHQFGRKKPTLIYDTLNKKMELAGGGYDIPDEGIDR